MDSTLGTHYFCPPPARFECSKDDVWGAHEVRVQMPPDLTNYRFRSSHSPVMERLEFTELLAHRFNMTTGPTQLLTSAACPLPTKRKLQQSPVVDAAVGRCPFVLADAIGVKPTLRSSYAWLGGKGPKDSFAVFPDARDLPSQLQELEAFVNSNRTANRDEMAEAIAHQLFMIHPLADGNGRVTRAFLLLYHRHHACLYALYLFWRLRFGKARMFEQWSASRTKGTLTGTGDELAHWLTIARHVEQTLRDIEAGGESRHALEAVCLHGHVTLQTLAMIDPAMGAGLAKKIVASWDNYIQGEGRSKLTAISDGLEQMKGNVC